MVTMEACLEGELISTFFGPVMMIQISLSQKATIISLPKILKS